jgi:hypothetical protein
MPNQENFRTNLSTITDPRYTASRIINVTDNFILNEEVPASFAFDIDDVIEVHFYTTVGNQRVLSTTINPNDGIIKSHIVSYQDNSYKNYIRIDFTKLFTDKNLILVPGDYRMVLNFFSGEIGTYENRKLNIDVISDSRTEVQLSFNDTVNDVVLQENLYLLKEFVEKGFNKSDAVGTAEKIFESGVQLNSSDEGLTAFNIGLNIDTPLANQTREDTLDRINAIGVTEIFNQQLNSFLPELYKFVREEIVITGDDRIQESEFRDIIQRIVKEKINQLAKITDRRIQVT